MSMHYNNSVQYYNTLSFVAGISGVVAGATVDHILKPIHSYTVQPMKDYIRFAIGAGRWFKNYDAEDLKPRILQFQEHLILLAAERIKSARPIFQRLEQDERYRVACIFNKLKYWSQRMIQAHESVKRKGGARPNRFQVHYYQRIHRMQIDVSYTVEFLYHIHKLYLTKVQVKDRVTARDKDMIKLLTKMKEHMHGSNLSPSESKFYQSMMDSMGD